MEIDENRLKFVKMSEIHLRELCSATSVILETCAGKSGSEPGSASLGKPEHAPASPESVVLYKGKNSRGPPFWHFSVLLSYEFIFCSIEEAYTQDRCL